MQIAKILLILTIFLSSCRSPNLRKKLEVEQCGITLSYFENGDIDEFSSKCECRRYVYSIEYLGGVRGTTQIEPLKYCDKVIGNRPSDYLKVVNFLGDVREDIIIYK